MKKFDSLFLNNFKGGINALLPIIILVFLFSWAMKVVFRLIEPVIIFLAPRESDQTIFVKISALIIATFIIYTVGALIRHKKYRDKYKMFENRIFKILPGYTIVKETILQLIGTKKQAFTHVAIVRTFGSETKQVAFITSHNADGTYTVFVPTGPNPTSGNIYVLKKEFVKITDISVEHAMKTIIACGIGSADLILKK